MAKKPLKETLGRKLEAGLESGRVPSDFCENLRLLCSFYRSVAEVCRKLNVNRAQFNRYLNGTTHPSNHMLERLCDFFGVESSEIFLPHDHFRQMVQVRPKQRPSAAIYQEHVSGLQARSKGGLDKYLGYYFEYYYSMSAPGKILRGLVYVFSRDGAVYHERIEHFRKWESLSDAYKCHYLGAVFQLNDRIFLVDYESLTGNEIAQTILFPTYKNRVGRLTGLMLGVSSSNQRRIACTRILFEWLGNRIDLRKALSACGLFDPGDSSIDPWIINAIDNSTTKGEFHLYATSL